MVDYEGGRAIFCVGWTWHHLCLDCIAMPTLLTDSPTISAPAAESGGAAGYSHRPDAAAIVMKRKDQIRGAAGVG